MMNSAIKARDSRERPAISRWRAPRASPHFHRQLIGFAGNAKPVVLPHVIVTGCLTSDFTKLTLHGLLPQTILGCGGNSDVISGALYFTQLAANGFMPPHLHATFVERC